MKEKMVLRLISKIKLLDDSKMELVEKAANSCMTVQCLERINMENKERK